MTFELVGNGGNCQGCEWIAAEGTITQDTPDRFAAFHQDWGYCPAVTFNSPGGDLAAAIRLGRLLRDRECATAVADTRAVPGSLWHESGPGVCESACAFAFMGGNTRYWHLEEPMGGGAPRSRLGVQQFFNRDGNALPSAATQQIMGQLLIYLMDMEIDPEVLTIASRTPANGMHYFTVEEVARLGLSTERGATPMRLEVEEDGLALTWDSLGNSGTTARRVRLFCDRSERAWVMWVADYEGANASLGFEPENPGEMHLDLGEAVHRFQATDILHVEQRPEAWVLGVRLPVDIGRRAGQDFFFQSSGARNWFYHLSAEGTLPDKPVMDLLRRACVS